MACCAYGLNILRVRRHVEPLHGLDIFAKFWTHCSRTKLSTSVQDAGDVIAFEAPFNLLFNMVMDNRRTYQNTYPSYRWLRNFLKHCTSGWIDDLSYASWVSKEQVCHSSWMAKFATMALLYINERIRWGRRKPGYPDRERCIASEDGLREQPSWCCHVQRRCHNLTTQWR